MADPSDGQLTIHSNDMKSYGMRVGVATFLGIPRENVRVLWTEGPLSVRGVQAILERTKPTGYTTALKLMQIMADKGLVERDEEKRAHVYFAARPKEWTQQQLAGDLLHRAFNDSASGLLLGALSARKTSREELDEIRRLLDKYDKGER
jgi:predicted transcriptional regulator